MDYDAWLCSVPGLYWNGQEQLIRYFGSAKAVYEAGDAALEIPGRKKSSWIEAVRKCRSDSFVRSVEKTMAAEDIHFCSRKSPLFPGALSKIGDCPVGFFYKGKLPAPDKRLIAVVGARGCTSYGAVMARQITRQLVRAGFGIVSGMALGIDACAQEAALEAGGTSVAVLGCGVDRCYPPGNIGLYTELCKGGCLISEFPCSSSPLRIHFPLRNRLISGLSEAVVVIEARKKSGALITADYALEQGRDVYALPGRVGDPLSEGCNDLIAQGSGIITSPEDLVCALTGADPEEWKKSAAVSAPSFAPGSVLKKVYDRIGTDPVGVDTLEKETGLPVNKLYGILQELEMEDLIIHTPGNRYMKKT